MKHLANCSNEEFLIQTNKIRKAAAGWLKDTKILEIRKNQPKLKPITPDMDDAKAAKIKAENDLKFREQVRKNISDMLDAALETNAKKTSELLALLCFVEPKDAESHKMTEYLKAFGEMIANEDVMDFFTSLMRLANKNIFGTVNQ